MNSFDTARDDIALALALGADLADPDLALACLAVWAQAGLEIDREEYLLAWLLASVRGQ